MEPTSTTAVRGSTAAPEIHTDVPGHVIPILEREFDDFDTESTKFLRGETEEVQFVGFRGVPRSEDTCGYGGLGGLGGAGTAGLGVRVEPAARTCV